MKTHTSDSRLRVSARTRRRTLPLLVVLAVFGLLVMLHSLATPPFEAPDEIWHYSYVRWLAEGHGLPAMDDNASGANQEVAQPPLYYAAAALLSLPFADDDLDQVLWHNPGFGYQAPGTSRDNKAMLIHPRSEPGLPGSTELALRATRLASLGFGLLAVAAAWGLGNETFGTRGAALTLAALVAFHPQFVFMCSVVNNDAAAAAISTTCLWLVARCLRRGLTLQRAAVLGALSGCAALAKTSGLLMVALAGAAVASLAWRQAKRWHLLLFGVGALCTGAWWYVHNLLRYGDLLGLTSHLDTLWGRQTPATLAELLPELPLLARSFWAAYGWGHITWPTAIYVTLGGLSLVALLRGITLAIRARRGPAVAMMVISALWLGCVAAALLHWMRQVEAPHGRLLFPALGAWALLLTPGLVEQLRPPRWTQTGAHQALSPRLRRVRTGRGLLRVTLLGLLALVSTLSPGVRLIPTFAQPRLYTPERAAARVETATDLIYGGGIRLLGVTLPHRRLLPGQSLAVEACWMALAPQKADYTVFIHAIGPEESRPAERHTYPGLGTFPTTLWPVGRAFCDRYMVEVAAWAEAPMAYRVLLGLFDASTGERLSVTHSDGSPADPPEVGSLVVVPATNSGEKSSVPPLATLDASIELRSFEVPAEVAAGSTMTVTLYWEATTSPAAAYTAFVHLWEPGMEQPLAQSDAPPRGGWFPTTVWVAGDRITDVHVLQVPEDAPAGDVRLWAGLYQSDDGTRAAAVGAGVAYADNLIPLGRVRIVVHP